MSRQRLRSTKQRPRLQVHLHAWPAVGRQKRSHTIGNAGSCRKAACYTRGVAASRAVAAYSAAYARSEPAARHPPAIMGKGQVTQGVGAIGWDKQAVAGLPG